MCGIYCTSKKFKKGTIYKKMDIIKERGPDNMGFYIDNFISLSHNRLSIIDLDKRSNQPMVRDNLKIIFNGEIYNFLKLKKDLENKNHVFKTNSDTEVIIYLYKEYGEKCLEMMNGMFSFVIYDSNKKELFIARDRTGQKPLYYTIVNGEIEISSQIKQLEIENNFSLNERSIYSFFKFKYIMEPETIYNEVLKFPAASFGKFSLIDKKLTIKKYWKFSSIKTDLKENIIIDKLSNLLEDSVKIRMISDVPLGVFLSGGIDSSLIAATAQKNSLKKIKTFNVKFHENKYDESIYAERIANYLGTDHTKIECSVNEIINLIKDYSISYDEPFADPSSLPTLLLSKYTKKHVTVALSGDGGDEVFLGYNRYIQLKKYSNIFKIPYKLREPMSKIFSILGTNKSKIISSLLKEKNAESFYYRTLQVLNQEYFNGDKYQFDSNFKDILNSNDELFSKISKFDICTYLSDDINVKVDRATMNFSLESRSPFLDYRILEFGSKIPSNLKFKNDNMKYILKKLLRRYLPEDYFNRPKSGFTIPLNNWFRSDLKDYLLDNLSLNNLKNIPNLNIPKTNKLIENHMSGKVSKSNEIFKLLVLTQWLNR